MKKTIDWKIDKLIERSTWSYQLSTQPHLNEIKDLSKAKGSEDYLNVLIFHLLLRSVEKVGEWILFGPLLKQGYPQQCFFSANFFKSSKI